MKGKDYFNWFNDDHKVKWLNNFHESDLNDNLEKFMEEDFPHYYTFFFLSFDVDKSKEGREYWTELFHKYKKYDHINIKPGYGPFGLFGLPKPKGFEKK